MSFTGFNGLSSTGSQGTNTPIQSETHMTRPNTGSSLFATSFNSTQSNTSSSSASSSFPSFSTPNYSNLNANSSVAGSGMSGFSAFSSFAVNDDDDDFGFGDIESEIKQMESDKLQQEQELIEANKRATTEAAFAPNKKGMQGLASQSSDSLLFHSSILEAIHKRDNKKMKPVSKVQKKKDAKAAQKAQEAKDKLNARLQGGVYTGIVKNQRAKLKRNAHY